VGFSDTHVDVDKIHNIKFENANATNDERTNANANVNVNVKDAKTKTKSDERTAMHISRTCHISHITHHT
jgi:hypothetical protein